MAGREPSWGTFLQPYLHYGSLGLEMIPQGDTKQTDYGRPGAIGL